MPRQPRAPHDIDEPASASVLLLGPSLSILASAQRAYERVVIAAPAPDKLVPLLRAELDEFFTVDYEDSEQLAAFRDMLLSSGLMPTSVVSVTEHGLLPAAQLNEALGTIGTPPRVVATMRNKMLMRARLAEDAAHVTVPAVAAADRTAVASLLAQHVSLIVKPVDGTASRDIYRISSLGDMDRLPAEFITRAQAEPFIDGLEVTVECLSTSGQHKIYAIVEKRISKNFVELAHITPPPSLDNVQVQTVTHAVEDALDALGYTDGISCTEVILRHGMAFIVETHNRPGGDGLADLVKATTGTDWRRAAVGWPVGNHGRDGMASAKCAAMLFFTAPPGVVSEVRLDPPALPGVTYDLWKIDVVVGDSVGQLRSSSDRIGVARLYADSAQHGQDAIDYILGLEVVRTVSAEDE